MNEAQLRAQVEDLGPFFHDIELPFGVRTHVPERSRRSDEERVRVSALKSYMWPVVTQRFGGFEGLRVLDVATNCGGFAVEAARSGAREVIGVDIVDRYLDQARFVRDALELSQLSFRNQRIEDLDPAQIGTFDVVFCFDILYHFENPVLALRALASVTEHLLLVETRVADLPASAPPTLSLNFLEPSTAQNVDRTTSQWRTQRRLQFMPSESAVDEMLGFVGFDRVEHIEQSAKDRAFRWDDDGSRMELIAALRSGA